MPTDTDTPHGKTKLQRTVDIAVVTLSALVAVGVSVLFLTLTGVNRTSSAPRSQPAGYVPPIHHYGTAAPPTKTRIHPTAAH